MHDNYLVNSSLHLCYHRNMIGITAQLQKLQMKIEVKYYTFPCGLCSPISFRSLTFSSNAYFEWNRTDCGMVIALGVISGNKMNLPVIPADDIFSFYTNDWQTFFLE